MKNARMLRRTLGYGPEGETGMVQVATAESAIAGTACAIRPHVEDSGHLAGHRQEELELAPTAISAARTSRTIAMPRNWFFGMRVAIRSILRLSASGRCLLQEITLWLHFCGTVQLWTDVPT